ncbi:Rieske 2Fe-2S domain-containing protein [Rhodococcoides fascians]|uniref:Rieske 2Fe-2S domain-containing protein n=1 Tax=Rhodococcoides fascians TaxID=1828 RepID=UPI00050C54B6|nr:Rieske 2Fe-2S domain-containing protein [Rhodococcus fascians]
MAKMALSMRPTGWFQIGYSAEVEPGQIVRKRYFDQDLIVWRSTSGKLNVFDAYCEHLGAHLGYGGRVEGEQVVCPFHGWEWNAEGRNTCIPYQPGKPNRTRKIRSWKCTEQNEAIFMWHDTAGRDPLFDIPDIFTDIFDDDATASDYYTAYPKSTIHEEGLSLHPQFVIENGVDYAHFQFVHRAAETPRFTKQDYDDWHFSASFLMTFGGGKEKTIQTPDGAVEGGVDAVNCGISLGMSRFWGPDNQRTMVCVTPVDDETSDIFHTVWLDRDPGDESDQVPESMDRRLRLANNQFLADLKIWKHQRYTEPPGLATEEAKGFRTIRKWATRFYPDDPQAAERAADIYSDTGATAKASI